MLGVIALFVNVGSFLLVYGLAFVLAWLLGPVLGLSPELRTPLAWLIVNLYIVGGLLATGELPGIPRATVKLTAVAAAVSLALGLVASIFGGDWSAWLSGGVLPWAAALLAEALAPRRHA